MPTTPRMPRIVRKRSRLHGFGVFAAEPISKNTRIIDYAGELIRNSRSAARESRYLRQGCIWVFRVNRTWSRDAAVGVDGMSWREYEEGLLQRVIDLHARLHSGAYRATPSRRVYIPKADGRLRPLGIASLEDKIVQHAVVTVLNVIYEEDFLGFSYGFRPGRSQHDALDALTVALQGQKVNWILDADITSFFDEIDHE